MDAPRCCCSLVSSVVPRAPRACIASFLWATGPTAWPRPHTSVISAPHTAPVSGLLPLTASPASPVTHVEASRARPAAQALAGERGCSRWKLGVPCWQLGSGDKSGVWQQPQTMSGHKGRQRGKGGHSYPPPPRPLTGYRGWVNRRWWKTPKEPWAGPVWGDPPDQCSPKYAASEKYSWVVMESIWGRCTKKHFFILMD